MNIKKEGERRPNNGIKILNDHKIPPMPLPAMTSLPLSPVKQINISLVKSKSPAGNSPEKKKHMDHYVLQTVKGEATDDIDFIFTDNNEAQQDLEIVSPSGEITEEVDLGGHDNEDETVEEIVEHVCGKCYRTFRRFSGLKKHLDFCRFDSGYHLRKAEMIKNLDKIERDAVIMENKDICFCCGESYDTFHLGHINCPDCPKSFKTQISYERHIFITHCETPDNPCDICNAKLRTKNLLALHLEQHKNRGKPYACKVCGKDFTRSYHLKRHQKQSSCAANEMDSMNCRVCNKVFYRLDNLRTHLKLHLGTQITKKPEYMCPICKSCFYSLSTLNIHTRTHTGERPFDCDLCEKKFPSLVALKKHRRYHTGEKPYTCHVCNQSFAVKEVLNRHMKRHTGERPHECKECGKRFIQHTQLRSHAKTHIRPFPCKLCDGKFKTEKQLERHVKTHNTKRRKPFKCEICPSTFANELKLKSHMEMGLHLHNQKVYKGAKCYECAICEFIFDNEESLQCHMERGLHMPKKTKTHTPKTQGDDFQEVVKEHACEICQIDFPNEELLKLHMERGIHQAKDKSEKEKQKKRVSRKRRSKVITYCSICEKNFDTSKSLQFHVLKEHESLDVSDVTGRSSGDEDYIPLAKMRRITRKSDADVAPPTAVTKLIDKKKSETAGTKDVPLKESSGVAVDANSGITVGADSGVIVNEFVIEDMSAASGGRDGILLQNEAFTIIPLDSVDGVIEPVFSHVVPKAVSSPEDTKNNGMKMSLGESLAAAIADDDDNEGGEIEDTLRIIEMPNEEGLKWKEDVHKLLDMLVDNVTLQKFGWPNASEENVLCKVIENCGHDLSGDAENFKDCDYTTRMREYVKLLFTVVIHNDSIKELLNNYPIDEVIEYVLGNDEDDDDNDNDADVQVIHDNKAAARQVDSVDTASDRFVQRNTAIVDVLDNQFN